MRGLEKNRMKRDIQTRKHTDGHRDSMKESAKGRFFENVRFSILLVVLGNTYLEEIIRNGFYNFCILETNPFNSKNFTPHLVNDLHQRLKGHEFIIHH